MRLALSLAVVAVAACSSEPTTCAEAACDGATDFCLFFGSDVAYEPSSASCRPLPTECADAPSCACLAASPDAICAEPPCVCDDAGDVITVTIPGG